MISRRTYSWLCRNRSVELGKRTLVMGILNVTPDSFSDGGSYGDPSAAVDRALTMVEQGADMIDIGGESTRPGATPVTSAEELSRVIPTISKIREQSDVLISIDTMKAETAAQAMSAGADIINDISAFEHDSRMIDVAADTDAGVILMHMKGSPQNMQDDPSYGSVVHEVGTYLKGRIDYAMQGGVHQNRLVVDPGLGFGKTLEHNLQLLRALPELSAHGTPVLVGASRKSFIGKVTKQDDPALRLAGSLGVAAWAVTQGAHILRVHDVIDTCEICRILDTLIHGDV